MARPRVGAHVSFAGGPSRVLPRARRIGAEAVQVFPSNPRQWRRNEHPAEELAAFGAALAAADLPLFVHTIYLINLASPDPGLRARSGEAVAAALVFAARAGAAGVVTHVGSHRGDGFGAAVDRVSATVRDAEARARRALDPDADLPPLLLETAAGAAHTVGGTPRELGALLAALPAGVGACLDTAHLFAAGQPIHTRDGLDRYLEEAEAAFGLARVGLVHLNDCKSALGSRADRHENLWEGRVGREGLALWLNEPSVRAVPFVLETPGFAGEGPDRKNLDRAKRLRGSTSANRGGRR